MKTKAEANLVAAVVEVAVVVGQGVRERQEV